MIKENSGGGFNTRPMRQDVDSQKQMYDRSMEDEVNQEYTRTDVTGSIEIDVGAIPIVQTQVIEHENVYAQYADKFAPDGQALDDTNPIFKKLEDTAFDGKTVREVPVYDETYGGGGLDIENKIQREGVADSIVNEALVMQPKVHQAIFQEEFKEKPIDIDRAINEKDPDRFFRREEEDRTLQEIAGLSLYNDVDEKDAQHRIEAAMNIIEREQCPGPIFDNLGNKQQHYYNKDKALNTKKIDNSYYETRGMTYEQYAAQREPSELTSVDPNNYILRQLNTIIAAGKEDLSRIKRPVIHQPIQAAPHTFKPQWNAGVVKQNMGQHVNPGKQGPYHVDDIWIREGPREIPDVSGIIMHPDYRPGEDMEFVTEADNIEFNVAMSESAETVRREPGYDVLSDIANLWSE